MAEYIKEKWSADFPDRAGQEVRPTEAVENTLDYDVLFPQYLSEDPVVFNQQNRTVSQLVSNDARLYERISATAADINAHLTDAKAHASGISGNAASATKLQTGRKIHRVVFDGTRDITLPDFSGCGEKTAGQSGMVPSPSAGKLNTVLHSNGSWGKVTYADMDEEAVAKIQACPFPVNAIYISTDGKNPATYWPGTTWVAFAMGRKVDEPAKLIIAAFVGAVAGFVLLYIAAWIGVLDAPRVARAAAGVFVLSLLTGLAYAWIGFRMVRGR